MFKQRLIEVCEEAEFNIKLKNLDCYNMAKCGEEREELPVFLGMQFSTTKRDRAGKQHVQWRHDPSRLPRWHDLQEFPPMLSYRTVARAVGVLLWDATISARPLYEEELAIGLLIHAAAGVLRARAKKIPKAWDAPVEGAWKEKRPALLAIQARIDAIIKNNPWIRLLDAPLTSTVVRVASDACGGTKETPSGWGFIIMNEIVPDIVRLGGFPADLKEAHIYIKEMYACCRAVEHTCTIARNAKIEIGIDNTAVVGALRGRYSSNQIANDFIKRIDVALRQADCTLEVIPLRSEDNPADAPSRGKFVDVEVRNICLAVFDKFAKGLARVEPPTREPPPVFNGGLRHEDHDILLEECPEEEEVEV